MLRAELVAEKAKSEDPTAEQSPENSEPGSATAEAIPTDKMTLAEKAELEAGKFIKKNTAFAGDS